MHLERAAASHQGHGVAQAPRPRVAAGGPVSRWRPTLAQALGATFAALALVLVGLLWLLYAGSRRTLLHASEQVMLEVSRRITLAIDGHLAEAEEVVGAFEATLSAGLLDLDGPEAARVALLAELTRHRAVGALSLTQGRFEGFYAQDDGEHEKGEARLQAAGRWQVSVARGAEGVTVSTTAGEGGRFETRVISAAGSSTVRRSDDPTRHPTFVSPAREDERGHTLWSDLSFAEGPGRHRVVTVQKALWSPAGTVTVLRVALLSDRVDELTRLELEERGGLRPLIFIADAHGHLLARTSEDDRLEENDVDEVRVVPAHPSPELVAALRSVSLASVAPGRPALTELSVDGTPSLLTVTALPEGRTQSWRIGALAPEAYFLADLHASMRTWLVFALALALACLAGGAIILRATRRDLGRLIGEATRLSAFDFAPATLARSAFEDVGAAADSLEQAKTALRALGKYVPLELVRQLYQSRVEPTLGGKLQEVTMVFSDLEGFTSISEALPPDVVAAALGRYLEVVTSAVHQAGGIIDKYTGDGVMALWNAPSPCPGHALRACEGVLAAIEATEQLFASAAWAGLGPWRTRFGIHRAWVSVGHFGAPDRMSYTVMGDGVNLASRLESLNKQYGTAVLVSGEVQREASARCAFRRIDRVAVKGKRQGIEVYELLGRRGESAERSAKVLRYEQALDAYFAARFREALELLGDPLGDPPSVVLAERCQRLARERPKVGWDGVFAATEK